MSEREESNRGRTPLLAALVAVTLYVAAVPALRPVIDPDIFMHLRAGEWIVEHRQVPEVDPFGQHDLPQRWLNYSWLFDLVIYRLYQAGGAVGVMFYAVVVSVLIAGGLLTLVSRFEPRLPVAAGLTSLFLLTLWPMINVRSWLIGILLFILMLAVLLRARETARGSGLFWLFPIFALWANLHIQFVYGFLVIALFAMEPGIEFLLRRFSGNRAASTSERNMTGWFLLGGVLAAAGSLVNPYGWGLTLTILEYASQVGRLEVIELMSPEFNSLSEWLALFLAMAALVALVYRRFERPLPFMLLVVGVFLFLNMRRDVWFLSLTAVTILAMSRLGRPGAVAVRDRLGLAGRVMAMGVAVVMLVLGQGLTVFRVAWHEDAVARYYPQGAVRFIQEQLGRPAAEGEPSVQGPLFNPFDWGSYLTWALPELQVSMDGRTNVYGTERILRNWATFDGEPGWDRNPDFQRANLVVTDPRGRLERLLSDHPHFVRAFEDPAEPPVGNVYARVGRGPIPP